jgi:hypothetical protein
MNRFLTLWFCAAMTVAAQASLSPPDLLARIHFAGAGQIAADTNAVAFTNLWCTPEAQALCGQTLDKLSRAPGAWFKSKMSSGTNDEAVRLRPLLDDLLNAEWLLQVRDATNGSPEYALAIHLDAVRARLWRTNGEDVLEAWTGMSAMKTRDGWELKKHLPPNLVRFVQAGDWVVFGVGQNELPLNDEIVRRIQADQRPAPVEKDRWLTADLDWPRLARWFPESNPLGLPETQMECVGRGGNLRLNGKLIFPQPLALKLGPWQVPTNTIRQPFVSFTAVRGIAPWLEKQNWLQPYEISPLPDQMFIWAMTQMPLQTFVAVPVADATNALGQLFQKLSVNTNWQNRLLLPLTMMTTSNQIFWQGLPMVAPSLRALHEPAGDFLFAGAFPNTGPTGPLPPELVAQLDQTNLVYYDWEITGERLKLLPSLTQLALMMTRHRQLDALSVAGKWLAGIGPTLGPTATEVMQTAPNELTFMRKASGGLTAIELTALANWLEATNFPGCNLDLPSRLRRLRPQTPGAPAVKTPAALPAVPVSQP